MPRLLLNWKKHKQEFNWVMVFIMRSSSILKFQFVFGFNECLWAIFFWLNFENFWFYAWVAVVWLLILRHKWFQVASSHPCQWKKNLSTKTTKYISKCWKRSVIKKTNPKLIRVITNSSFDQHFLYIWIKPF